MAKKKKDSRPIFSTDDTIQAVLSVISFVFGIILILAAFNLSGVAGDKVYGGIRYLVGLGYFLLPLASFALGAALLKNLRHRFRISKIIVVGLALLSGLALTELFATDRGGVIGSMVSAPFIKFFDIYVSVILLSAIVVVSLLIAFDASLALPSRRRLKEGEIEEGEEIQGEMADIKLTPESEAVLKNDSTDKRTLKKIKNSPEEELPIVGKRLPKKDGAYEPYPLSILESDKGKPGVGDIKANANVIRRTLANFGIIVEMDEISIGPSVTRYALKPAEGVKLSRIVGLQNDLSLALAAHPIRIEAPIPGKALVGVEIPNSTKTTVGLATLLSSDEYKASDKPLNIALGKGVSGKPHFANLAKMPHILIAGATGSGKSVTIHSIVASLLYRNSPDDLKFIMIDPKRVELTLYNKIPHLLTPVITESKKAILALKWAAKEMDRRYDILESEQVRDIQSYHKNIVEPELAKEKSKNTTDVAEEKKLPETMPYIVIIIDELADIMQAYPRELESAIVRLAQMSRAVGIHLILSTQRPSVNVITGLIKANIPTRIALQVISQIDSRTILDTGGAEKLLGAGDMLYLGGEMSKPQRIQSPYITETEVKKITKYLADNYEADALGPTIGFTEESNKNLTIEENLDAESIEDDDVLYEEAKQIVTDAGKASTSYIQRKLRVGYSRAARLMDLLEERGVIGPQDGAKARSVVGASPENSISDEEFQ